MPRLTQKQRDFLRTIRAGNVDGPRGHGYGLTARTLLAHGLIMALPAVEGWSSGYALTDAGLAAAETP